MHQLARVNAVLSNGVILYSIPNLANKFQVHKAQVTDMTSILETCVAHNIRRLWVTPGDRLNSLIPAQVVLENENTQTWDIECFSQEYTSGRKKIVEITSITGKRSTEKKTDFITIVFTQHTMYDIDTQNPIILLGALSYACKALDRPIHQHPGVLFRDLLEQLSDATPRRREQTALVQDYDFSTLPFAQATGAGGNIAVQLGVEPDAIKGLRLWLHGKDKTSMYLAAATSAKLGIGAPVHITDRGRLAEMFDKRLCGFWHIEYDPDDLPLISPLAQGQEWAVTSIVSIMIDLHVPFIVTEAYLWFQSSALLDTVARYLADARQDLKMDRIACPNIQAAELAADMCKRVATVGVGLLGSSNTMRTAPRWFRPHWTLMISEDAKARLYRKILQVYDRYKVWPVMVKTDALYYVLPEPEPDAILPGCFDKDGATLGGWKNIEGFPVEVTPAIVTCFKPGMSASKSSGMLDKILKIMKGETQQ